MDWLRCDVIGLIPTDHCHTILSRQCAAPGGRVGRKEKLKWFVLIDESVLVVDTVAELLGSIGLMECIGTAAGSAVEVGWRGPYGAVGWEAACSD